MIPAFSHFFLKRRRALSKDSPSFTLMPGKFNPPLSHVFHRERDSGCAKLLYLEWFRQRNTQAGSLWPQRRKRQAAGPELSSAAADRVDAQSAATATAAVSVRSRLPARRTGVNPLPRSALRSGSVNPEAGPTAATAAPSPAGKWPAAGSPAGSASQRVPSRAAAMASTKPRVGWIAIRHA